MAYHIGKITNTHGIRGEVKIYNLSDFDRFLLGSCLYVMFQGKKTELIIETVRKHKNLLIVKFKSYDHINQIEHLKGQDLYTDDDVFDQMETDDFHYNQLIGKPVFTDDKIKVGLVMSVIEVPQGHLLEIEKIDGKKVLVPFIEAFIAEVNDESIIITPIEGLL
jgi:16S rRNA processing protein RimM